ncbi:hypothetical protein HAP90_00265 [Klebsiella quasipneumoniae subsp. similipneumoniae]|uniref:hypothetical protein n=1 Tax=Klebsiella quasipneumoniae TaxID=1463165 RepID=UPI0013FDC841|nr:hypothetical protein [Klebsiella quasipneumoniae]NHJ27358.1 hypothetical protein [Klebsiella quasipneumoniae subsp. similipneumoniae]NHJ50070.1 hypothetical protein [Klebsiella quasipneumoniae subsp. similipneumoniae]NHJ64858.1 hypothetical protein [Klebsiella quasipneumoniae subsp. similipneumoniae]NHJ73358.1 hypothetical protein [Klebsiella quasipneumoniae subsp. similipneumoniae]NHJ80044.1 hypothetical protein [Klebsiella quasipneumoniae subsp. similipneumoniae]
MARPKKIVETPGQEKAVREEKTLVTEGQLITAEQNGAQQQGSNSNVQNVEDKLVVTIDEPQPSKEALLLAGRNAILATLNAQGAAIVARFEEYAFTDSLDHPLTNNLDFLSLVRKATDVSTGGTAEQVTNEEGKKQPVRSAPVLTEHGWHVPG